VATIRDIDGVMRLVWHLRITPTAEDVQWGVHAGAKDVIDYGDVFTAMDTLFSDLDTNDMLGDCTLTKVEIQTWQTGPGYVGFHNVSSDLRNVASTTTADQPPQICLAVGYRCGLVGALAYRIQSRRNRCYVGPLSQSNDDTGGGRMSDTRRDTMSGRFTDLDNTLKSITPDTGWEDIEGLAVTSPTNGVAMLATDVVIGRGYDTMRSRRQKVNEDVNVFALP